MTKRITKQAKKTKESPKKDVIKQSNRGSLTSAIALRAQMIDTTEMLHKELVLNVNRDRKVFSESEKQMLLLVNELFISPLMGINRNYWVNHLMTLQTGIFKRYDAELDRIKDEIANDSNCSLANFNKEVSSMFLKIDLF